MLDDAMFELFRFRLSEYVCEAGKLSMIDRILRRRKACPSDPEFLINRYQMASLSGHSQM